MTLFLFLFVGFSVTNAIVFLHVFAWFRKLVSGVSDADFRTLAFERRLSLRGATVGRLVRCHACTGFWVGGLLSLSHGGFIVDYIEALPGWEGAIADGFLVSGGNFVLWVFLRHLGAEEM